MSLLGSATSNELESRHLILIRFPSPRQAFFLDRDGVLIEDKDYLCKLDEVLLCAGAKTLVEKVCQQKWPVVLITNQFGIARSHFYWQEYE